MKTRLSSLLVFVAILTTFTIPEAQAMRWYSPSTGRWLSRDPIDELGFNLLLTSPSQDISQLLDTHFSGLSIRGSQTEIPLYVFVVNNPVSKIDVLGLQSSTPSNCERCGPDITEPLKQVIAKVRKDYASWGRVKRWMKCKGLTSPTTAAVAWDIDKLSPSQRGALNTTCTGCPTTKCLDTVQVEKGCFSASRVNYVLFGTMGDLCGWSLADTTYLVDIWKTLMYGHASDPDTTAWATAGWHGWPSSSFSMGNTPPTQPQRAMCTLDCPTVSGPFDYIWLDAVRRRGP